jgi:hypothetical protein
VQQEKLGELHNLVLHEVICNDELGEFVDAYAAS